MPENIVERIPGKSLMKSLAYYYGKNPKEINERIPQTNPEKRNLN